MIFVIELLGLVIKHFVLAVRLLANMMAGHLVLADDRGVHRRQRRLSRFAWGVMPASVLGRRALKPARVVRGLLAGLHFHVSCPPCSSAWPSTRTSV